MGYSHYHVNKFDACELSTSSAGIEYLLKMSLRNARVSLEFIYENVINDTTELCKLSRLSKTTFYRSVKKFTEYGTSERKPGKLRKKPGRPQALTPDDKRSICQRALQNHLSSNAKITRELREARDV